MTSIWIARLHVSPPTRQKLIARHGLDPDYLRERLVCVSGLRYAWHEHPERGWRAIVMLREGRRQILVVLYPTDEFDIWHLGSAYLVFVGRRWENGRRG